MQAYIYKYQGILTHINWVWLLLDDLCSVYHAILMLPQLEIAE